MSNLFFFVSSCPIRYTVQISTEKKENFFYSGGRNMKIQLPVTGFSQYDHSVNVNYQASACGPVTAYVVLNYLLPNACPYKPNDLYKTLGTTRIGLFTYRFLRNMRKILGPNWKVEKCTQHTALSELQNGRPVALKFDKYFSFQWNKKFTFSYHWVPLIGYELENGELFLIIHDNGWRNRASKIRKISYAENSAILTFVQVAPKSQL